MALNLDTSSMLNFVVDEGFGVKGMVEAGLSKIPERYILPAHERITDENTMEASAQPQVIDFYGLDGPQHDEFVAEIVNAARTAGFFQVVNHGLSMELLEELKVSAHPFFDQPAEMKSVYLKGVSPTPLVTYTTSLAPEKAKSFEWIDTLTIFYSNDEDEARKHWPEPCKEVAMEYLKTSTVLGKRILQILFSDIGVALDDSMADSITGAKAVAMNIYPPCPQPDLTIGIGRHSDFGTLTILLQDDVGGLFVKLEDDGGKWVEITPIPGALVVMVGDSLEILSNGKYNSPEHTARPNRTQSRVSVPVFLGPTMESKIKPLAQLTKKDGGPRYEEILFGEYIKNAYSEPSQGKKLLNSVKITSV